MSGTEITSKNHVNLCDLYVATDSNGNRYLTSWISDRNLISGRQLKDFLSRRTFKNWTFRGWKECMLYWPESELSSDIRRFAEETKKLEEKAHERSEQLVLNHSKRSKEIHKENKELNDKVVQQASQISNQAIGLGVGIPAAMFSGGGIAVALPYIPRLVRVLIAKS